ALERTIGFGDCADGVFQDAVVVEIMLEEFAQSLQDRARIVHQLFEPYLGVIAAHCRAGVATLFDHPFPIQCGSLGTCALLPRERPDVAFLRQRNTHIPPVADHMDYEGLWDRLFDLPEVHYLL